MRSTCIARAEEADDLAGDHCHPPVGEPFADARQGGADEHAHHRQHDHQLHKRKSN
ncbi:MAG: hypothetical protein O7F08_08520 [Deltaproteobacteria bacterium]|nr:hypothetical protein [Deltaproteobacteria bacterium]